MDDTTNDQPVGDTHDAPGAIAPADGTPGAGAAGTTGGAAALQADAMKQRWATLGADQRLVVAGAATVLIAYFLGLLLAQWSLGLSSVLSIVGAAAVLVMVLAGPARLLGMSKAAILRISAGVVGAYSLIDLGDLISELGYLEALDLILWPLAIIGAGLMVFGVWRMTGGNVMGDTVSFMTARGRTLPARLAALGSAALIVGWAVLSTADGAFRVDSALSVLAVVLIVAVLWLDGSGSGEIQLPITSNLSLAVLGVVAGILTATWLLRIIDELSRLDALSWLGFVLVVAGSVAIVAGGLLGMGPRTTEPSA